MLLQPFTTCVVALLYQGCSNTVVPAVLVTWPSRGVFLTHLLITAVGGFLGFCFLKYDATMDTCVHVALLAHSMISEGQV